MEARLKKWGNSYAIRIPNNVLKSLGLKNDDKLELIEDNDKIIITRRSSHRPSLEEKFKNYKGPNLAKEFEWDAPHGKEVW